LSLSYVNLVFSIRRHVSENWGVVSKIRMKGGGYIFKTDLSKEGRGMNSRICQARKFSTINFRVDNNFSRLNSCLNMINTSKRRELQ
jgi:hypothetical protein